MLDLEELRLLDADNLPFAVYLSPVQTSKPLNDFFDVVMFVGIGVRLAKIFGSACPKYKWSVTMGLTFLVSNDPQGCKRSKIVSILPYR